MVSIGEPLAFPLSALTDNPPSTDGIGAIVAWEGLRRTCSEAQNVSWSPRLQSGIPPVCLPKNPDPR